MKRRGGKSSEVKYHKLRETVSVHTTQEDDSEDEDSQELNTPAKPPWRSIALATFLCIVGVVLLIWGSLLFSGVLGEDLGQRATPMLILGGICFLPGFYNVRIAYYAWKGNYGYSFNDIPS